MLNCYLLSLLQFEVYDVFIKCFMYKYRIQTEQRTYYKLHTVY